MFTLGALIALRDLGLLHRVRFLQGVGWANIALAQLFSVLRTTTDRYIRQPPPRARNRDTSDDVESIPDPELAPLDVTRMKELHQTAMEIAWQELNESTAPLEHHVFHPLLHGVVLQNQAWDYGMKACWAWWCGSTTNKPLLWEAVAGHFGCEGTSLLEYPVEGTRSSRVPVFAFTGKAQGSTERVMVMTNDTTAPQLPRTHSPYVQFCRPHPARTLAAVLCQTLMSQAEEPYEVESALGIDPCGFAAIYAYYLRFCHRGVTSSIVREEEAEDNNRCVILIDGRCAVDELTTAEVLLGNHFLGPPDQKYETPRFYQSQCIRWHDYPNRHPSARIEKLLQLMQSSARTEGWTAMDAHIACQAANWGHALTYFRYGTERQRRQQRTLLVGDQGDPYEILQTLYPHLAAERSSSSSSSSSKPVTASKESAAAVALHRRRVPGTSHYGRELDTIRIDSDDDKYPDDYPHHHHQRLLPRLSNHSDTDGGGGAPGYEDGVYLPDL